ncbi:MAG: amidohydrolase [Candidatus Omnitrophica bacterium]|nr:amidohydrolase [Candidatus Omnitrophota bacterium]
MKFRLADGAMLLALGLMASASLPAVQPGGFEFNDAHFHLTNYIQEGTNINDFLRIMGNRTGRVALFGIPLQQLWSYRIDGDRAPKYYLDTDAPLYYYSFTDAFIAMAYRSLTPEQQARFDPMITGFNPTDMYAADQIRRVLQTFPGVFTGIGEFSIHKEFVSAKVAGPKASLLDPALDRLLDFAREVGLVVLIHNDLDRPFAPQSDTSHPLGEAPPPAPVYLDQMKALFKRHPGTTIIWAHMGVGRIVRPIRNDAATLAASLADPQLSDVYFDLSWEEVAKYIVSSPEATRITADLISHYPDRFLFGTDEVAPANQTEYMKVYDDYQPLWKLLSPEASRKVRLTNYERIFDQARRKVRTWEAQHVKRP